MSTPKILYLEDDPLDVDLLGATLAGEGVAAELVHVRTPWEFSAALKTQTPDLILLDGKVSGFGGLAALHIARAACPAVPAFGLTGMVTEEMAAKMRAAGATGYFSKQDLVGVAAEIRQALVSPRSEK